MSAEAELGSRVMTMYKAVYHRRQRAGQTPSQRKWLRSTCRLQRCTATSRLQDDLRIATSSHASIPKGGFNGSTKIVSADRCGCWLGS